MPMIEYPTGSYKAIFDANDVDKLVNSYNIPQLENRIKQASIMRYESTSDKEVELWCDFIRICKLAIDILKTK